MTDAPDQTGTSELGEKPAAQIEPGEPNPGGADALPESDGSVPADLPAEKNPAVDTDHSLAALGEGEDTSTKATESQDADGVEETEETPA